MTSAGRSWRLTRRDSVSVTVTYRRADGAVLVTKVGIGDSLEQAVSDADNQLRPGRWLRLCASTVVSIRSDLQGRTAGSTQRRGPRVFEGKTVSVREPREVRK